MLRLEADCDGSPAGGGSSLLGAAQCGSCGNLLPRTILAAYTHGHMHKETV